MGQVHENQDEMRKCYNQAVRNVSRHRQVNIVDQRPPNEGPFNEEATTGPIEDLVEVPIEEKEPSKVLKLGNNLFDEL